ncbi:helix-turn-helix domain-containing protein [Methanoregula sp. PtaB.Bin085]|uniref:helix-turn-helix domain-containing protein n=1 Tax=Methanoregula sp. PtaB.Bin085 TaxID=1811680 RepID=UPI0009D1F952|nr:helix-turn-helix domain-containing protein [Methanoregula sp. PtaB.Bin085]OPX64806.1 MAG: Bacterioopsin transcriptional activator [Methanoregula sp. PtaB.Bin085]
MKKMTVRLSSDIFDYCKSYGQVIERFEVISLFNMVDEMHSEVCKFTIKEGIPVDQISCNYVSNLIVLQQKGREYTCLVRGMFSDDITKFVRTYGSRMEHPIVFENDCLTFSMVGDPDDLNMFVKDAAEKGWGLDVLSVCDYIPVISGIFDILTPKQREILLESYRQGFFEHPRKINAGELAEKMGMHKTTLLEHIHKAEKRLIGHILAQVA